jgi:hypothetical protein
MDIIDCANKFAQSTRSAAYAMSKRVSGTPRHPRSPVAKAVRTPAFKMRVVPDKRWPKKLKDAEKNTTADAEPDENDDAANSSKD